MLCAALMSGRPHAAAQATPNAPTPNPQDADRAAAAAVTYLSSQLGPDGCCKREFDAQSPHYGGKTALCTYALLAAGGQPQQQPLKQTDFQRFLQQPLARTLGRPSPRSAHSLALCG